MNDAKNASLLMLRYYIRDEFTDKLKETCNIRTRMCRGGSRELYRLLVNSRSASQYLEKMDKDHLQIVSGLGHTFIRYKDDKYGRYIYIDPTISQFLPSFDGIFVGTREELEQLTKLPRSSVNITNYVEDPKWTRKTHPPLTIENSLMVTGGRRKTRRRSARRIRTRRFKK
jgi:hypothetical protein